jgi:hypothetical protein
VRAVAPHVAQPLARTEPRPPNFNLAVHAASGIVNLLSMVMSGVPPGQHDYSTMRLSRHALERFVERFAAEPEHAANDLRRVLSRTRRLGRNPENGAIAVLAIHGDRVLVAILQQATCLTVLTWNQFVPRLAEFGRTKVPRKWGRLLRRLSGET